jgi:hypothetical protein
MIKRFFFGPIFFQTWQMWIKFFCNYSTLTITTYLNYKYSHVHNFYTNYKHTCLQSSKTPNSWLLKITWICISKHNARNHKQNYNSFSWYFLYYKKFTQQFEYGNYKSLYLFVYWKLKQNTTKNPMFYWNVIK